MDPIKTLILTGQHNHAWEKSSVFFMNLLNESGRFCAERTTDPDGVLADADRLSEYQLIFDDYNGPMWSDAARGNFEAAIAGGTGLVIYHAANNPFSGWTEFEKMCGICYRSGTCGGHSEYTEIRVAIRDREHVITKGMDNFSQMEELYHSMENLHDVPVNVLATAYSEPDPDANMHGSGLDEAVAFTVQYGQGRVFHCLLGHIWKNEVFLGYTGGTHLSLVGEPVKRLYLRGSEWAATGTVAE